MSLSNLAWAGIACAGVLGSALCSGSESALYRVDRLRIESEALEAKRAGIRHSRASRLSAELHQPDRLLATLLIANNAFNYVGVLGIAGLLHSLALSDAMQMVVNVILVTPLLLVFAESLPKELFRLAADRAAYAVLPVVRVMRLLLTVLVVLPVVLLFSRGIARLLGSPSVMGDARARLSGLLIDAAGTGSITPRQAELIDSAMGFGKVRVRDVMHAWTDLCCVVRGVDRRQLLAAINHSPVFGVPVVEDNDRSCVVGVVWKADALASTQDTMRVRNHARLTVGQDVLSAAQRVARSPARVGVVLDNDIPVGLVTLDDLVEPLLTASSAAHPTATPGTPHTKGAGQSVDPNTTI